VEPPALLTALSRRIAFLQQFGRFDPKALGIAVDKPVTASASLEAYPARLAIDGGARHAEKRPISDTYGGEDARGPLANSRPTDRLVHDLPVAGVVVSLAIVA
jgi:hypothetical protein